MHIAFIGLGNMGGAIADNLAKAGHALTVWNRSPEKAERLVARGARLASAPRAAAAGADVVFTMLADDAALWAVTGGEDGILAGLGRDAIHVSMSTVAVDTAERMTSAHREAGRRFVSAPVFGRPEAATAGKLFVVAAGADEDVARVAPLFDVIGQRRFHVGRTPSSANLVKLCGNFLILSAIESMGEAMALAQKGGIAREQLFEIITGTLFDAPVYRTYGAILSQERYRPAGFAAPLGLKDMRLVGQAAEGLRVPMPFLGVLRDHLLQTIAQEGEEVDWSAIGRAAARNGGL